MLDVNTAAIGLYRRMGYLPDGVRNMYQPGVDAAFCKPFKELVMRYQPQDQGLTCGILSVFRTGFVVYLQSG